MSDTGGIVEIVLTGGPCAGKSSSLEHLSRRLADEGYLPVTVPEVATMIFTAAGLDMAAIAADDHEQFLRVQASLFRMQRAMRADFRAIASGMRGGRPVILYDRAEMDIAAYMGADDFAGLLEDHRLDMGEVRDSYTGVVHLRSTALGAEEHYSLATNAARHERDIHAARAADARTERAWSGHPRRFVIENEPGGFARKLERAHQAIRDLIAGADPHPHERPAGVRAGSVSSSAHTPLTA